MQHAHAITPLRFNHLNSTWTEVQLMTLQWAILSVLLVLEKELPCVQTAPPEHTYGEAPWTLEIAVMYGRA
jgi:hypothetical protein